MYDVTLVDLPSWSWVVVWITVVWMALVVWATVVSVSVVVGAAVVSIGLVVSGAVVSAAVAALVVRAGIIWTVVGVAKAVNMYEIDNQNIRRELTTVGILQKKFLNSTIAFIGDK